MKIYIPSVTQHHQHKCTTLPSIIQHDIATYTRKMSLLRQYLTDQPKNIIIT